MGHDPVIYCLVRLDTTVKAAVSDHLPAVHRLDPFNVNIGAAMRPWTLSDLHGNGIHASQGYVLLAASGIPNHEVAGPGALRHLPTVHGATSREPGFEFGDVLGFLIHLKHVYFDQGAFQTVRLSAHRDVISRGASATVVVWTLAICEPDQYVAAGVLGRVNFDISRALLSIEDVRGLNASANADYRMTILEQE